MADIEVNGSCPKQKSFDKNCVCCWLNQTQRVALGRYLPLQKIVIGCVMRGPC